MSPLREWKCSVCGYLEEVYFHKESEVELPKKCPKCDKVTDWKRMPPLVAKVRIK